MSRRWSLPSAFITKISELPLPFRSLAKAILVPSGDQRGDRSIPNVDVSWVAFEPSAFATQTVPCPVEGELPVLARKGRPGLSRLKPNTYRHDEHGDECGDGEGCCRRGQ